MNHRVAHTGDLRGRASALAAFDRSDDRRGQARLTAERCPDPEPVRAHGPDLLTHMRFDHDSLSIDLWVRDRGGTRSLSGLVVGEPAGSRVQVRRPGHAYDRRVALDGSFGVVELAPGPVSLVVRSRDETSVVTDWFTV
ncbi:hypothetical protein [Nocardiopsis kunsanensis]|uniref:Uncharacterized protein n=1 Tax=Nocardiopsis kunsanensis TaxID=141693 RepID=A0A918XDD7_9ACTN|nr:hypothetical protein [Nocardiopsis kunsanensis]GHD26858.1 hypothetical protein GCM10007147_25370 [Nocardiopsis kunsanensis]